MDSRNCVLIVGGGFWYKHCYQAGVNGRDGYFDWYGIQSYVDVGRRLNSASMWLTC